MKVSGFTFIRNALKFDFPIVEAITSILPLCDEMIVAVGKSEDDTLHLINAIDPDKIKVIETVWDDSLREGGRVLAEETNKSFREISTEADWAFYIQGDEVVHEKYHDSIRAAMLRWKDLEQVDGLLFNYLHFYGSYEYVGCAQKWYPHEIRIVKNKPEIYSYRDAQGFRKGDNQKLNVKLIDAYIYHYGYVKDPIILMEKARIQSNLFRDDAATNELLGNANNYDFASNIDILSLFDKAHPKVMQERIARQTWNFEYDLSSNKLSIKNRVKKILEKLGISSTYKNYKIV